MHFNTFRLKPGSAWAIIVILQLAGSSPLDLEYEDQDESGKGLNLMLITKTIHKTAHKKARLQCMIPRTVPLTGKSFAARHLLMSSAENTMYDEAKEGESHEEICYRNKQFDTEQNNEFNPNPPTMDPNLLPPTKPELKIKSNSSIIVSWQAIKREKYPIDFFMVEFYQYNDTYFHSKCCTTYNNTPKANASDSHHEEVVDGMEPGFDYKFRVGTVYPTHNFSWGPLTEKIHLPVNFVGDDDY